MLSSFSWGFGEPSTPVDVPCATPAESLLLWARPELFFLPAGGAQDSGDEEMSREGLSTQSDGSGAQVNETAILTLIEFMALSRTDAIQLLEQHNGSVEAALAYLLS